jgi:hypothetical protein
MISRESPSAVKTPSKSKYISSKVIDVLEKEKSGQIDRRLYRLGRPQEAITVIENRRET